ncbi:MAG: hypothetical protein WDO18_12120 [Acidobacteriota bacterium]
MTKNGELARVVQFLSEGRPRRYTDWKDRFKENSEKMADGSLLCVAEVLKSLLELQAQSKILSFREKKMLGSRSAHADHRTGHLARNERTRSHHCL